MAHLLLKIVSEWKKFRQFGSDLLLHDLVKRICVSTMEFVTKASCFSVSIPSYLFAIATNHFITCIFLLLIQLFEPGLSSMKKRIFNEVNRGKYL